MTVGFAELRPPLTQAEALVEADRCLDCGGAHAPAPCAVACPAGIDVASFIRAVSDGDTAAAARTIIAENLLGGTCARVCPVEMLCEGACVLHHEERRPIEIGRLQRFATETGLPAAFDARERARSSGFHVAVVGAGPAGLVCAGELALLGHDVTVYDERAETGGLARFAIAPYRIEAAPIPSETHLLELLGVRFRLGVRVESQDLRALAATADAVFLGVGMGADTDVRYPGDDLPGVWDSLSFVETLKMSAPPTVGRRVAVIGGGNTAIDMAREAVRLGAEQVTMIYRRSRSEMPAYPFEIDEAANEGVHFQWLASPVRFIGDRRLQGVECRVMSLGEPDESGRRRPEPVEGSEFVLPVETAIKAIGQCGHRELASWVTGIRVEDGAVEIDPLTGQTRNPKFFAGGDAVNGGATVVEAVRDGKRAAKAIDEWLRCAT
ncbi:MAG TPA: NAD(P)-dependent oxidoreductase [Gaiellaceae bacterium]|nr:NAD(P)-dependent oxidoreductase [Gaiellaceae bacterium]